MMGSLVLLRNKRDSSRWLLLLLTGLILILDGASAWSNEEYDMFDLVEEVGIGQNFWDVLGVPKDASDKDIRSAYRKMSVKLHPDKNPAEDAEVKFRQLVGIYEVLKNKELRESYERVLVEGLPNWRQPIFYFRRARKLAMWQVGVLLLGIISVGQYLAGWASYFEKRLSMKEQIETRLRKTQRTKKGQKEGPTVEELEAEMELYLPKPSLWNLAPFQICYGLKYLVVQAPFDYMDYRQRVKEEEEEKLRLEAIEEERLEKERLKAEEPRKPRKRKTFQPPERPEGEIAEVQPVWNTAESSEKSKKEPKKPPMISGGLWTDDDLTELARLCNKFPGGTPQRWETIAEFLNRPVPEVTFMAKKVLEKLASKPEEEPEVPQVKTKVKTKGGKADSIAAAGSAPDAKSAESWGAEEQKALEYALQCYPKGSNERWEKIANMVPNRTKEECMLRFKYVADLVKKKKEPKPEEEAKPEVPEVSEVPEDPKPEPPLKASVTEMVESTSWEPVKVKTKSKKKSNKPSSAPAPEKVEEPVPPVKPVEPVVEIISAKVHEPELEALPVVAPESTAPQITTTIPIAQEDPPVSPTLPRPPKKNQEKEPLSLLETSVEDQLKSLVEESLHKPSTSTTTTKEKEPLTRSDSKSSTDGESLVVVRRRGSKEASVERKNSSSSENDWCVIDEEPSQ